MPRTIQSTATNWGGFFHGYYDHYCYLPLHIVCGDHPLLALLRPSNIDAATDVVKHLARIVAQIRKAWTDVQIVIRGDSGFCREELLRWCEEQRVDYVVGLAKNARLLRILEKEQHEAQLLFAQTGKASRVFRDFSCRTRKSWLRARRVIGKAEHLQKGANPRFVVTSLSAAEFGARQLYEQENCGRGNMETRIKEQQLCLFADRTSCQTMRANQLRLAFSTVAYILLRALREFALKGTSLEVAKADTIRLKFLRIGAVVRVTGRKAWIALSSADPWQEVFARAYEQLAAWRQLPAVISTASQTFPAVTNARFSRPAPRATLGDCATRGKTCAEHPLRARVAPIPAQTPLRPTAADPARRTRCLPTAQLPPERDREHRAVRNAG